MKEKLRDGWRFMSQYEILRKCLDMACKANLCPDTPRLEFFRQILWAHRKGYLYTNKDATAFACAYAVPSWQESHSDVMPEKEGGDVLYVAWAVSESKNRSDLLTMLRACASLHNSSEVVYYRRNSDKDFKRMTVRTHHVKA